MRPDDVDKELQTIILNKLGAEYEEVVHKYRLKQRRDWKWDEVKDELDLW